KKEKNGVFAIFLVVFLFREAGQYLISKTISVDFDFWFWAMSVSGVLYLILKVLKKRTPLLKEKGR
ncbi:MAG: lipid A phosphate methyltransferase, partial [Bacteroidota bacterium]|nr:lipid A phosphate methyltransferase [Bacteroidota bacterium]